MIEEDTSINQFNLLVSSENENGIYSLEDLTLDLSALKNNLEENSQESELNNVCDKLLVESELNSTYQSDKYLSLFIRKNRNNLNEIIKKLSEFFDNNLINHKLLILCTNKIFDLLTENNQIRLFLDSFIPILMKNSLQEKNTNISAIEKVNNCIGKLIHKGGILIKKLIENIVDNQLKYFDTINNNSSTNCIYASIHLVCKIMENFPLLAFNKIITKSDFGKFLRVIKNFKDNRKEIRYIIGELIENFLKIFLYHDIETKYHYLKIIYNQITEDFLANLKQNGNIPNDYNIVSGYIIVIKKIHLIEPLFLKNIYTKMVDDLFRCRNCGKNNNDIKIAFIKFMPDLYFIHKTIFIEKYAKSFLEYLNSLLNIKTNLDIRKQLLLTMGAFSSILKEDIFKISIGPLCNFLNELIRRDNEIDDEIFKCLADLLNNKQKLYIKIIFEKFNVYTILPKLFSKPLTLYQVEYLLAIMSYYLNLSPENITTTILSLNVISIIICGEEINLGHFEKFLEKSKINIEKVSINKTIANIKKMINKYMREKSIINRKNVSSRKSTDSLKTFSNHDLMLNALTLLSNIQNTYFYEDMFIFFAYKLLPILNIAPKKIYKKMVELILCKFIKEYEDDLNLSIFLNIKIHKELRSIIKTKNTYLKEFTMNIILKNDSLFKLNLKERYFLLLSFTGCLISNEEECIKKKVLEFICKLLSNSDNNFGFIFAQRNILSIIYELYHSNNLLELENLTSLLFLFTSSFKDFFNIYLLEKLLKVNIFLTILLNYKGITIINILKIINELFNSSIVQKNYSNFVGKLCDILYIICLKIANEGLIDDSKFEILLETIYHLIKIQKINIYQPLNMKNIEDSNIFSEDELNINFSLININNDRKLMEKAEKTYKDLLIASETNIVEILFLNLFESENDNTISIILKIFGLCGALYPEKMEFFFVSNNLNKYLLEGNKTQQSLVENEFGVTIYNPKSKRYEEIDLSNAGPSNVKAALFLTDILKLDTQPELNKKILNILPQLFFSITPNQSGIIEIILSTIIQIIPNYDLVYQNTLFEYLSMILLIFKEKCVNYIDMIIPLILKYFNQKYIKVIYKILDTLFQNYCDEIKSYYSVIIPKIISFINNDNKERLNSIKLIISLIKKHKDEIISPYFHLLIEQVNSRYIQETNKEIISAYLNLFEEAVELINAISFFPSIINILLDKLSFISGYINYTPKNKTKQIKILDIGLNKTELSSSSISLIIKRTLEILQKISKYKRAHFFLYIPLVLKTFIQTGIFPNFDSKQILYNLVKANKNYLFNKSKNWFLTSRFAKTNCVFGVVRSLNNTEMYENLNIKKKYRNSISRNNQTDINKLINYFDNSHCIIKEDWSEWHRLLYKVFFEESPSYFLHSCYLVMDYPIPLMNDLFNYSFYSIYNNSSDSNKIILSNYLKITIQNFKTPSEILLSIVNLVEFMDRKCIDMALIDYYSFGTIAYKCKAYAKSLYYKENDFLMKNDTENFEKLLKIYYILKIPEAGIGLLKLLEKKKFEYVDDTKDYKWYINLHDYEKAIQLINKKLEYEEKRTNIEKLEKYKLLCLKNLCEWEELLNDYNEDSIPIEDNDTCFLGIKSVIQKEIILSQTCAELGNWEKLKKYVKNIKNIFINNIDEDILNLNNKNDINKSIYMENNDSSFNDNLINDIIKVRSNEKLDDYDKKLFLSANINSFTKSELLNIEETYIPFNELIYKCDPLKNLIDNDEILYDINILSSIACFYSKNYEHAIRYVDDCKKIILRRIKSLLNESYSRSFRLFAKNQELFFMENIIDYGKNHSGDINYLNNMKNSFDKVFDLIANEPVVAKKLLIFYRLAFPIQDIYDKYLQFSKLCRKREFFVQCQKVLMYIKRNIGLNFNGDNKSLTEINIKIDLNYNKCLFEKGDIDSAIKKSKILVDLLENKNINNEYLKIENNLKSKIYGDYAIYKIKKFGNKSNKCSYIKQVSTIKPNKYFLESKNLLLSRINTPIKETMRTPINKNISNKNLSSNKKEESSPSFSRMRNLNILYKYSRNSSNDFAQTIKNRQFLEKENEVESINNYLMLATKYNPNNHKYLHNYTAFNYGCYKHIFNKKTIYKNVDNKNNIDTPLYYNNSLSEINFAINAVNGMKNRLSEESPKKILAYEESLWLLDIFFNSGGENNELLSLIETTFNSANLNIFIFIIPQLISRLGIKNNKVLEILIKFLIKLFLHHPRGLIFPFILIKGSNSMRRKSIIDQIFYHVIKKKPEMKFLIKKYEMLIKELNKCAILLHEEWHEALEISVSYLKEKNYQAVINQLLKMHKKMNELPESMYEIHFYQRYKNEFKEAEIFLEKFIENNETFYFKEAWEIYQTIFRKMKNDFKNMQYISLEYISPKLSTEDLKCISIPGSITSYFINKMRYTFSSKKNINFSLNYKILSIKEVIKTLYVFNTKQHPRKISFIGSDDKEYKYLLKGHEDLRQDERVEQIFNAVNSILFKEKKISNLNLLIKEYIVTPMSKKTGLIGWVPNCDTIGQLILEYRTITNFIKDIEYKNINKLYPKYDTGNFLTKVEIFKEILKETRGLELNKMIWLKSNNCESWLIRRTNYSRSLAVMSIVGYILGLGDRHPNNLMMERQSGQIIHIDFGDCFEVTMQRRKFPEKVPFRLTRMLVKALEVSGIEGNFRIVCEYIMKLLRENKDSLIAILKSLIYDPLISFRLMVPNMIKNKKKEENFIFNNGNEGNNKNINIDTTENRVNIYNISSSKLDSISMGRFDKLIGKNIKKKRGSIVNQKLDINCFLNNQKIEDNFEKEENINETYIEDKKVKNEKNIMKNEERLMLNYCEDMDEVESEELNKIAQMVLMRIINKLKGYDFDCHNKLKVEEQVNRLINQATSDENLARSYLGWMPFW